MAEILLSEVIPYTPPSLELPYSRWRAITSLVFTCACMLALAYGMYGFSFVIGKNLAQILFVPYSLFILWRIFRAFNILRWRGPVVVLDQDGLTDRRRSETAIPWQALHGFSHTGYGGNFGIVLKFKDVETARCHTGRLAWIERITLKMNFENGEIFIALSPLRYRYKTIVVSINGFLKYTATKAAAQRAVVKI